MTKIFSLAQSNAQDLSDEQFFYKYVLPVFQQYYPMEHYSYWMFANISRQPTGMDKRRVQSRPDIAQIGQQIHELFRSAKASIGQPDSQQRIKTLVDRLRKWYDSESARGLVQRPEIRKLDYNQLRAMLPDHKLSPSDIKVLSSKIDPAESRVLQENKREFQEAYIQAVNTSDISRLNAWHFDYLSFWKKRPKYDQIFKQIVRQSPLLQKSLPQPEFFAMLLPYSRTFNEPLSRTVESGDLAAILRILQPNNEAMPQPQPLPFTQPTPAAPETEKVVASNFYNIVRDAR